MTDSPINLHRSLAGLIVGNLLAILISGVACFVAWQTTHPVFFKKLHEHIQSEKPARPNDSQAASGGSGKNPNAKSQTSGSKASVQDTPDSGPPADPSSTQPPIDSAAKKTPSPKPDFPLTVIGLTLLIDVFFSCLAGFLCVKIAGFSGNHHGVLMAFFILVWKIQQLVGFVENQLPALLLSMELIALPVACLVGASLANTHQPPVGSEDPQQDANGNGSETVQDRGPR